MLLAAVPLNALSAYVFHDVDKDMVGQWSRAFSDQMVEVLFFIFVADSLLLIYLFLARKLFKLPDGQLSAKTAFLSGIFTILLQYPFDYASRAIAPSMSEKLLWAYLLLSPVACASLLLLKQRQSSADSQ
jgi:hypothetical protein